MVLVYINVWSQCTSVYGLSVHQYALSVYVGLYALKSSLNAFEINKSWENLAAERGTWCSSGSQYTLTISLHSQCMLSMYVCVHSQCTSVYTLSVRQCTFSVYTLCVHSQCTLSVYTVSVSVYALMYIDLHSRCTSVYTQCTSVCTLSVRQCTLSVYARH